MCAPCACSCKDQPRVQAVDADVKTCRPCRAEGGLEAERAMRQKLKEEEDAKNRRNHEFLTELRAKGWREVGGHG